MIVMVMAIFHAELAYVMTVNRPAKKSVAIQSAQMVLCHVLPVNLQGK